METFTRLHATPIPPIFLHAAFMLYFIKSQEMSIKIIDRIFIGGSEWHGAVPMWLVEINISPIGAVLTHGKQSRA